MFVASCFTEIGSSYKNHSITKSLPSSLHLLLAPLLFRNKNLFIKTTPQGKILCYVQTLPLCNNFLIIQHRTLHMVIGLCKIGHVFKRKEGPFASLKKSLLRVMFRVLH